MYPIITISREFGSGGHSIGQAVAKELGIPALSTALSLRKLQKRAATLRIPS